MHKFGFSNFRKFEEFSPVELNNVNFLVGSNNSGKSSFIKALVLFQHNMHQKSIYKKTGEETCPFFSFCTDYLYDPNIRTFGRAVNSHSNNNIIEIVNECANNYIKLYLSRFYGGIDYYDKTEAPIIKVVLYNKDIDVKLTVDYNEGFLTCEYNAERKNVNNADLKRLLSENKKRYSEFERLLFLEKSIKAEYVIDDFFVSDNKANILETILKCRSKEYSKQTNEYTKIVFPIKTIIKKYLLEFNWTGLIHSIFKMYEDGFSVSKNPIVDNFSLSYEDFHKINFFSNKIPIEPQYILASYHYMYTDFVDNVNNSKIEYIGIHAVKPVALFNVNDKNDYIAQVAHAYINSGINDDSEEFLFVKKWLNIFEIGTAIEIESFHGESFRICIVTDNNGKEEKILLSDKGTGTIHIVTLLMQLASIIRLNKTKTFPPTIIIEEPEQNLHPKFQSILVDLLCETAMIPKKYNLMSNGFRFIIETHSEYMIRHSQVIVKQMECKTEGELNEKNPFTTIYFPEEGNPYTMIYRTDGKFANDFGSGFFDEADKQIYQVL